MTRVLVPLASGSEELEAVTMIDLFRRAGFEVTVAGQETGPVTCSRATVIHPESDLESALGEDFDLIAIPGGLPGANHLRDDPRLITRLQKQAEAGRHVAAICAAPKVLAQAGLLQDRRATCFTGALDGTGVESSGAAVEIDGNVITGRGPGVAMDFALAVIEELAGRETREAVEGPLLRA
ncbi:DJ-1 family glyoxalase III [Thioalkalivibrio sp. ALR17-21]|uniref:DJ-1 family glyoxalase III n=1 Tax=Thioalkalivibrio sp. ALR17-21 TaxID=1269813 RepID=UPI000462AAAA|nr:DJ-1 family glyoxalase III [Thioalkalivibrio sp. ALR17-21]